MTATQNIPRPANVRPLDARGAATLALLDTLPAGTEVVYSEVPASADKQVRAAQQRAASAKVISFRKSFSNRKGRGALHTRTETSDGFVRAFVYSDPRPYTGKGAAVDVTTTYVNTRTGQSIPPNTTATTTNPTTATVTVNVPAPVANPKRTKASTKTGKRRYVRRAESYARHLETGDLLARGYFLPQYKTTKLVTAWPFKNTSVSKETLQRRAYSHAQQLNKLAAESERPFKFVVRTTASAVRINVVLTD